MNPKWTNLADIPVFRKEACAYKEHCLAVDKFSLERFKPIMILSSSADFIAGAQVFIYVGAMNVLIYLPFMPVNKMKK